MVEGHPVLVIIKSKNESDLVVSVDKNSSHKFTFVGTNNIKPFYFIFSLVELEVNIFGHDWLFRTSMFSQVG